MKRVIIVGGGLVGARLVRRLDAAENVQICRVFDGIDEKNWDEVEHAVRTMQADQVFLAALELEQEKKNRLRQLCKEADCVLSEEPSVYEIESRKAQILQTAQEHIEELLGRKLVEFPLDMKPLVQQKTILVTGAGGTIGSEICRILAECKPEKLILMDIAENDTLRVMKDIAPAAPNAVLVIGSVTHEKLVQRVFASHRPQIVFHAAAHKHVPLMETNVSQCIENNVFGTYCCADAARRFGTESFVLISTDKAAQPVSVMGKAKRICEIMMRLLDETETTSFCSVRFGNVIGSSGSVLQTFAEQIAYGGPVTLTDRRMTRFFMTSGEAARLVISAAFLEKRTHMYMLDMGQPVSIAVLAERLLKLLHQEEIPVVSTGKRKGEKLAETLCAPAEQLNGSGYSHIFAVQEKLHFPGNAWFEGLEELRECLFQDENAAIRRIQKLIMEKES